MTESRIINYSKFDAFLSCLEILLTNPTIFLKLSIDLLIKPRALIFKERYILFITHKSWTPPNFLNFIFLTIIMQIFFFFFLPIKCPLHATNTFQFTPLRCLLASSMASWPFFPLKLISILEETIWDDANSFPCLWIFVLQQF